MAAKWNLWRREGGGWDVVVDIIWRRRRFTNWQFSRREMGLYGKNRSSSEIPVRWKSSALDACGVKS